MTVQGLPGADPKSWSRGSLAFSPDSLILASGSNDAVVRLWEATTGKQLRTVATADAPEAWAWSWLAFSPDGKRFLAYGWDRKQSKVIIWDAKTWKQVFERQSRAPQLRCFAFMPKGSELAVGMQDGGIELWDTESLGTVQE